MSFRKRANGREIALDEIFLDSSNLPHLDGAQFEGRVERPISTVALAGIGVVFTIAALVFMGRAYDLQVLNGSAYADISRENRLSRSVVFAPRGVIYDKHGTPLAWNEAPEALVATSTASTTVASTYSFPVRQYRNIGLSHVLGFVSYPRQDASGEWWREEYEGVSGAEHIFDSTLHGENGSLLIETDARGAVQREHIVVPPVEGRDITLTIDASVQEKLHMILSTHAEQYGFRGGSGIIMDVKNGDLLALTSFPGYDNTAFAAGDSTVISAANENPRSPLLNRAASGLYAPGSIVKPIFASAALAEGIIDPEKQILSTGQLVVPNPYNPDQPSIFRDWKAHGWVDMRKAIAVSSDQYFYAIGGGVPDQAGLGIERIDDYARAFGLGRLTGIPFATEAEGVIPTPEWKEKVFDGDPWRLGDTYITAIGQFGFQITPLQAIRFVAAIANGGTLIEPRLTVSSLFLDSWGDDSPYGESVGVSDEHLQIVREGMREAVHSDAADRTARALDLGGIEIAGKTGTAEVGERNQFMNSWVVGFWPASDPHYAFAVVLERAPAGTLSGASPAMQPFFNWLIAEKPEYIQ